MLSIPEIIELTRATFPHLAESELHLAPVGKGGSDRVYFRIVSDGEVGGTMIFMEYTDARPDNARFVDVAQFFRRHGIAGPIVFASDAARRVAWLEDLGTMELWEFRKHPWQIRKTLYRAALKEVAKLHEITEDRLCGYDAPDLMPGFDTALYQWEQSYFVEQFLRRFAGNGAASAVNLEASFLLLLEQLLARPRALIHRDFQSQNVLIRDEQAILIDFQGMRLGLPEYDVGSLLFDPYVKLSQSEREQLLFEYYSHRVLPEPFEEWRKFVEICALQRLLQALGAYGNLGGNLGKTHFFDHIPPAMENLRTVIGSTGLLCELLPVLDEIERGL